jgi:hypothetical protein
MDREGAIAAASAKKQRADTMKMVEHTGSVVGISGDKAVIQLGTPEGCHAPGLRCACCGFVEPEPRKVRVPRGDLREGDEVTVTMPAYSTYLSTFLVFGLPIILFVLGATVGWLIDGRAAADDVPIIAGGVGGLVVAVLVAVMANRRLTSASRFEVRLLKRGGA